MERGTPDSTLYAFCSSLSICRISRTSRSDFISPDTLMKALHTTTPGIASMAPHIPRSVADKSTANSTTRGCIFSALLMILGEMRELSRICIPNTAPTTNASRSRSRLSEYGSTTKPAVVARIAIPPPSTGPIVGIALHRPASRPTNRDRKSVV